MNESGQAMMDPVVPPRPVDPLQPDHENAVLAIVALDQNRIADAKHHVELIPEKPLLNRAWKMLLHGRVSTEQSQPVEAESSFLQSAALAFIDEMGAGEDRTQQANQLRLCACALHFAGRVLRRRDKPADAHQTHKSSYHLREKHGSIDELSETAIELGLDLDLMRKYEDARVWYHKAVDLARQSRHDPLQKQAIAWTHLSNNFAECDQWVDAVDAARNARNAWVERDASDVSVAQAELTLGSALLKFAACLREKNDEQSGAILEESLNRLNEAHESLLAFGSDHAADAHWCNEQIQFAQQLQAAMVS